MGVDTLISVARTAEIQGDHMRAIDSYLQVSTEHTDNIDTLEECWEKAAELAMKFIPGRARTVVVGVAERLAAVDRYEPV